MALDFMPYRGTQMKQHLGGFEYPPESGETTEMLLHQVRLLLSVQEHVQTRERDLEGECPPRTFCLKKSLKDGLSLSNCMLVREFSTFNCPQLTASCDAFIRENFAKMLDDSTSEKDIIGLPRVQVNVDVSRHTSQDSWVPDQTFITGVVQNVARKLSERFPSKPPQRRQLIEEKLVSVELMADMSLEMSGPEAALSLEKTIPDCLHLKKKQQSPTRALDFQSAMTCCREDDLFPGKAPSCSWEIMATQNVLGMGAVSLVRCENNDLLVLNIQLVTKGTSSSLPCPISPTTGIPLALKDSFFAQMDLSRSGFGAVALDDDTVMSVGGFNRDGVLRDVEFFAYGANSWARTSNLLTPRARLAVVAHDNKAYAIGGSDGKHDLSTVEVFSNWSDLGAAVLDGRVYAVGGACYSKVLRSVEVLSLSAKEEERKWKKVASMVTPRRGAAVVSCNGCVYAIGGQAQSWGCLKTVECYHPASNEWQRVSSMSTPRRNAAAVVIEDRIFVIGGYNESSAVNSMEVYDPSSDSWSKGEPMVLKRSGACAVCVGDAIFVVGGFSGSIFLNSVEKYEVECKQWTSYFTL